MSIITALLGSGVIATDRNTINTNITNLNTTKKEDSMTTNKLLGRSTAGTGAIEEITLGTGLSYTGTTLNVTAGAGDMILASTQTVSGLKTFLNAMFALRNVANTFSVFFSGTATADRTVTLRDSNGTMAYTSDITGVNSGTNTGDETTARINTLYGAVNALTVGSVELGNATDTTITRSSAGKIAVEGVDVLTESSFATMSNKRRVIRVETLASSATPGTNTNNSDITKILALATNITSMTSGLVGAPNDWEMHAWEFTDNGTARTIATGASFENGDLAWATTTVISTPLIQLGKWNATTSKWRRIA